jgi:molecular chaperone GrpE
MAEETSMTLEQAISEIEKLGARIVELEAQNEEYLNGWKRAKADYINLKNEQEKRSTELAAVARVTSLIQYLPVLGYFRKAFQHLPAELEGSEWVKGIEHIYNQMKEIMKNMGVEEVSDLVGTPFNPSVAMAVGQEYREGFEDDVVTQEVDVGYRHNGVIILPAKVIVNKKPS